MNQIKYYMEICIGISPRSCDQNMHPEKEILNLYIATKVHPHLLYPLCKIRELLIQNT